MECESRTSQQRHLDLGQEPPGGEHCRCLRTDLGREQGVAVGKAAHMEAPRAAGLAGAVRIDREEKRGHL